MSDFYNLTQEQKEAIEELKKRTVHELTPKLLEDETLFYRFLAARDFNLNHAETLLRKHLSDRRLYGTEELANGIYDPPEHMYEYFAVSLLGCDKEGSPVRYIDLGGADIRGICSLFSFKEVVQRVCFFAEEDCKFLREQNKKLGKSLTKYTYIMNMDKLDIYTATAKKSLEYMVNGFKVYQDNYPERIKHIFIINASFYFYVGWPVIKKVLSGGVIQKIQVFGKDCWKEVLLHHIDIDVLPAFLGGKRTDPDGDPMCHSFILHGKPMPEELYIKKIKKTICNEKGVKKLKISRFSSSEIFIYVDELNTNIEWEFESKTRDIGFGLYYKNCMDKISKTEELLPKQRIDTKFSSVAGFYNCDKVGVYIIVFDNSYSWIYSKEIYYRFRLIKPKLCQ